MVYTIHGYTKSKGTFTNRETGEQIKYDNIIFHTTHKGIGNYTEGDVTQDVKIASKNINTNDDFLYDYIGRKVEFDVVPLPNGKFQIVGILRTVEM